MLITERGFSKLFTDLRALLSRIQGSPNDAESSLRSAMAGKCLTAI